MRAPFRTQGRGDDPLFSVALWLRRGARSPARARCQVLRLRPRKELRITLVLADEPVDECVAVLRRAELRHMYELRPRLLGDRVDAADAQDIERIDDGVDQAKVHLPDHFLLTIRM